MDFSSFLLMRQEIVLLCILLLLIIAEIFIPKSKKGSIVHLAIFLFGIHTVIGFMPIEESSLFGGMFRTNGMIHFFKNVLNVGVLILLLQSADWIQEKVLQHHKGTEFFILMFSSFFILPLSFICLLSSLSCCVCFLAFSFRSYFFVCFVLLNQRIVSLLFF